MEETHCWLVAVADEKAKVVRSYPRVAANLKR